jgi:hypothetical protein
MKLPVQAPAVDRGSYSWPEIRRAPGGKSVVASAGGVINCTGSTPYACMCDNGIATCCSTKAGCSINTTTGACNCEGRIL